ncbi:MAG TPA: glycosyltransferase family 87 protein, partial [Kofleriaceae bacterium]
MGLAAVVLLGRMAVFMVDADQRQLSIQPSDPFRTAHSCLTAYAEAARYVRDPGQNIYDAKLYEERWIHGLKVDTYEYPPPFLLVPGAMQRVAGDYLRLRPLWFVMQLLVLVGACIVVARWLGGALRTRILLASPLFLIAPTTLFTMQMGNFQSTAVALAIVGMIALESSRTSAQIAGGFALAYAALSKIFPGVLTLYLLATRRWRAALWTACAGLVLIALTLIVYGTTPFDDFLHYQLPRLSSGEAFPQSEFPRVA